ncbi:hypothetical protein BLNAU_7329 [Blattamonas nauphoetae]|uniref:Uncharacterized protein n=1 Tax=Blattamonas nauphoetae TaxID=2049346 RepID=A0ABQ9Y1S0_9EUKA|nr:hypothetical protein BLNAU_7329 [Blattamonas nauphoetae]
MTEKDPQIQAAQLEQEAESKMKGVFKNFTKAGEKFAKAGDILSRAKEHEQASGDYEKAANAFKSEKKPEWFTVRKYLWLAAGEIRDIDFDKALELYQVIKGIDQTQLPDNSHLLKTETEIGLLLAEAKQFDEALTYLESAESRLAVEADLEMKRSEVLKRLAMIYSTEKGDFATAAEKYKEIANIYLKEKVTKAAASAFIYCYGLCLVAAEIPNPGENRTPNWDKFDTTFREAPFSEPLYRALLECKFLEDVLEAARNEDLGKMKQALGLAASQLKFDQMQLDALSKIRKFIEGAEGRAIL